MSRATAYLRVSTEGQAVDGISLDAQRAKISAWCELNGYTLADVQVDAGISGKRADNRPALQAALDDVCANGGALVVYSLSRLARSTRDCLDIADRLDRAGADLVSLSEKIDTTSAAGRMVFRMLAVLAEFERDQLSERTAAALAHKRSLGERVGAVPFGFDLADDGIALVPNACEQRIIADIEALRGKGYSLRSIADELTRRGIGTKKGNRVWTHTAVKRILDRAA